MPGLLVGGVGDRRLERPVGRAPTAAAESVAKFGHLDDGVRDRSASPSRSPATRTGVGALWRRAKSMLASTTAAPPSEVAQISSRRSGSATIGEAEHLLDGDLLAVPGVGVGQAVAGVLHLDLGEVLVGGAVEVHAPAGVEREVGRVGGAEQAEAQPVGVVGAVAAVGGEEALRAWCRRRPRGRRRTARPGSGRGRPRGRWRPRRRRRSCDATRRAGPAQRLGERGARRRSRGSRCGWCRRRRRTGRRSTRGRRRRARRCAAATPYSTKLRPHLPHGCMPTPSTATSSIARADLTTSASATGFHFQTCTSCSSSSNSVSTTSSHLRRRPSGRRRRRRPRPGPARPAPRRPARPRRWRRARARRRATTYGGGGW